MDKCTILRDHGCNSWYMVNGTIVQNDNAIMTIKGMSVGSLDEVKKFITTDSTQTTFIARIPSSFMAVIADILSP